jgi:small subunit ribosomal protein S9
LATDSCWATGRRKEAAARVGLKSGSGKFNVNGKPLAEYLCRETLVMVVEQPLRLVDMLGKVDIDCRARGGGLSGQAGAIRLGLSRALLLLDPSWRTRLKKAGFLVRDSRKVERKKYGMVKARKRFQYSKR